MEIHAHLVVEILGRPKEYVSESISALIDRLGNEKGVKVVNKKVHDPVPVKDSKDLFTTFAEIEAAFDSVETYLPILFRYMPSNVEVFSPENFKLSAPELSSFSNMLVGRLHHYDAIVKQAIGERDIYLNQLRAIKEKGDSNDEEKEPISSETEEKKEGKKKKKK